MLSRLEQLALNTFVQATIKKLRKNGLDRARARAEFEGAIRTGNYILRPDSLPLNVQVLAHRITSTYLPELLEIFDAQWPPQ